MFTHVFLGANDLEQSKAFYDSIMPILSYQEGVMDPRGRCLYFGANGLFGLTKPINGEAASHGNGSTIGFAASSPEMVDAWHAAGIANGGSTCEEPPGLRVSGERKLYLAYLRDPSGNKICACHRLT